MHVDEYRAMFELEDSLWWYQGMREITAAILEGYMSRDRSARILDVGCGTGYSALWLRERLGGDAVFGLDVSPHAATFWPERGISEVALGSVENIPFDSGSFNLVTCFDVIYQLSRSGAESALCEINRVLEPGGLLFIREPAYDWMRGSHDIAVATSHRFTSSELVRLLKSQGLHPRRATYANAILLPAAAAHRFVSRATGGAASDVRPVARWMNATLGAALRLEARVLRSLNLPFGLSVIVVAEKRQ
jgi:SAM-dependent methyltransferase